METTTNLGSVIISRSSVKPPKSPTLAKKGEILEFKGAKDAQKAAEAYIGRMGEYTRLPKGEQLRIITEGMEKIEKAMKPSTFIKCSDELVNNLHHSIQQFRRDGDKVVPSLQSLSSFFRGLQGEWWVKIHPKGSAYWFEFAYAFPPFTLEDKGLKVRFKDIALWIGIECYSSSSLMSAKVTKARGKKTHSGKVPNIHPHHNGSFCLGDYDSVVNNAKRKWDFTSLFSIYVAAVHTYYRSGSYQPLDVFTSKMGWRCSCGQWKSKAVKGKECHLCHRRFCLVCAKKKIRKENISNGACVRCGGQAGDEKSVTICAPCSRGRKDHYSCKGCGNTTCKIHRHRCFSCDRSFCLSCAPLKCPFCGGYPCKEHLSKNGEEGIAGICSYCSSNTSISAKGKMVEEAKKRLEKKKGD